MRQEENWHDNLDEDDRILPRPPWVKFMRLFIGLIAIAGLLLLSGIHQYFFLQRTPADIQQPAVKSKINEELIEVPVIIHILTGETGSSRTEDDARRLIANSNNIWSQADIKFQIDKINYIESTPEDLRNFEQNPHEFIMATGSYDPKAANVYLTRVLNQVNGLAYGGTSAVSVADYTSSLDFRTLAHEFGHLLGLPHVSKNSNLMASGGRGVELSPEEIDSARKAAKENFLNRR